MAVGVGHVVSWCGRVGSQCLSVSGVPLPGPPRRPSSEVCTRESITGAPRHAPSLLKRVRIEVTPNPTYRSVLCPDRREGTSESENGTGRKLGYPEYGPLSTF